MAMTFATDVIINNGQSVKTNKILAPTSSGGSTYGVGTTGQVLKSNGSNAYWADEAGGTAITNNEIDTLFPSS